MENKEFNAEQSLALMEKMINQARSRFFFNGLPLILWGSLISIAALLTQIWISSANSSDTHYINSVWIVCESLGIIGTVWIVLRRRKVQKTPIDHYNGAIWLGFGLMCLMVWLFFAKIGKPQYIGPIIMLFSGYATFMSGIILKFKPLMYSSVLWILFVIVFSFDAMVRYSSIGLMIVMLLGFVLPGYLLWKRSKLSTMFKPLDPLLHSELRLAIMSILIAVNETDFNSIREQTGASQGNLSVQLKKLNEAAYIDIEKSFKNNYPLTTCKITATGLAAFETYVKALKGYLKMP